MIYVDFKTMDKMSSKNVGKFLNRKCVSPNFLFLEGVPTSYFFGIIYARCGMNVNIATFKLRDEIMTLQLSNLLNICYKCIIKYTIKHKIICRLTFIFKNISLGTVQVQLRQELQYLYEKRFKR